MEEDNGGEEEESAANNSMQLAPHQKHPRISPAQLFSVLMIGIRAPMSMATAIVAVVGLVFLPDVLENGNLF